MFSGQCSALLVSEVEVRADSLTSFPSLLGWFAWQMILQIAVALKASETMIYLWNILVNSIQDELTDTAPFSRLENVGHFQLH